MRIRERIVISREWDVEGSYLEAVIRAKLGEQIANRLDPISSLHKDGVTPHYKDPHFEVDLFVYKYREIKSVIDILEDLVGADKLGEDVLLEILDILVKE